MAINEYSPLQLEGIQTKATDWTELIWRKTPGEALKDIEISVLLQDLQKQKDSGRFNSVRAVSFPKTSRERREEKGLGWEELPVKTNKGMLNNYVQHNN